MAGAAVLRITLTILATVLPLSCHHDPMPANPGPWHELVCYEDGSCCDPGEPCWDPPPRPDELGDGHPFG
jgi:hypothetical protein